MARLLIVDDDPDVLAVFQHGFEEAGIDVIPARSTVAAEDAWNTQGPFDYVIMDLRLGGPIARPNGVDLAIRLRALGCVCPILAVTGRALEDVIDEDVYQRAHFIGKMNKPVMLRDLVSRVLDDLSKLEKPCPIS